MRHHRVGRAVAVIAILVLALAGCSKSNSPDDISPPSPSACGAPGGADDDCVPSDFTEDPGSPDCEDPDDNGECASDLEGGEDTSAYQANPGNVHAACTDIEDFDNRDQQLGSTPPPLAKGRAQLPGLQAAAGAIVKNAPPSLVQNADPLLADVESLTSLYRSVTSQAQLNALVKTNPKVKGLFTNLNTNSAGLDTWSGSNC